MCTVFIYALSYNFRLDSVSKFKLFYRSWKKLLSIFIRISLAPCHVSYHGIFISFLVPVVITVEIKLKYKAQLRGCKGQSSTHIIRTYPAQCVATAVQYGAIILFNTVYYSGQSSFIYRGAASLMIGEYA